MPQLKLIELDIGPVHAIGAFVNILLFASVGPPDRSFLSLSADHILRIARGYPAGVGMIVVIESAASPPDDDARRAIQECYTRTRAVMHAGVHVVEGEGFGAAAKRAVLTLVNMTSRAAFPVRVAGTVAEAMPTLRKLMGAAWIDAVRPEGLAAAIDELRARLLARAGTARPAKSAGS